MPKLGKKFRSCSCSCLRLLSFLAMAAASAHAFRADFNCPDIDSLKARGGQPLLVQAPSFKYTVTNISLDWFDFENSGSAPSIFFLRVDPSLAPYAGQLRLRILMQADTNVNDPGSSGRIVLMDRLTDPLNAGQIGRFLASPEVFDIGYLNEPSTVDPDDSELTDLIAQQGRIPEMNMHLSFALTCDLTSLDQTGFDFQVTGDTESGRLRYVKRVRAEAPGTSTQNRRPVDIYTITPTFVISSDLYSPEFEYAPGQSKFTIFIHEVREGEVPEDVLNGLEHTSIEVFNEFPVAYPPEAPPLEAGKTYVWRARANLQGPVTDYEWSNPLYFRVSRLLTGEPDDPAEFLTEKKSIDEMVKYADDYNRRVLAALKIILGENFDIFVANLDRMLPAKDQLRINGQPISLEQLESLAKEFLHDRHTLTRVRFQ